ncbi:hypothetical protein CYMTET_40983 [Cymbomonas tetramitiformis]|uniref:Bud22 domain-containing protein n=1 Tax=Cymbomonas tetramitiformis TaxID=36881 RepID=A0AAE0F2P4_9CHLO|nr:hypothetical protein CYMTET_40983 [Cymbomonas tetramitiformis]
MAPRPWKQAKKKPTQGVAKEEIKQRKIHNGLKLVHRALKKAKQFAVRKICRRLQTAKEAKTSDAALLTKLQLQHEAVKNTDLQNMTEVVANEFRDASAVASENHQSAAKLSDEAVINAQCVKLLVGAKCVRDVVDQIKAKVKEIDAPAPEPKKGKKTQRQRQRERKAQLERGEMEAEQGDGDGDGDEDSDLDLDGYASMGSLSDDDEPPPTKSKGARADKKEKKQQEKIGKVDDILRPQKNRVGQRARRKLAEKLHGQYARHLAEEVYGKDGTFTGAAKSAGAAAEEDEAPQHPSWAAKRRQKELIAAAGGGGGRKMVFGEDGGSVEASATPELGGSEDQGGWGAEEPQASGSKGGKGKGKGKGELGGGRGNSTGFKGGVKGGKGGKGEGKGGKGKGKGKGEKGDVVGRGGKGRGAGKEGKGQAKPAELEGELHPSWVAKQRQRALLESQTSVNAWEATGKKIVFGNDE